MNALVTVQPSFAMDDLARMAHAFAVSRLFGVQNAEQALALCLVAQAEGRHPATAAQDYSIIQGRPSKKADAMLRDFLASGGKVEWHTLSNEKADATFSHPAGGSVRIDWTLERARAAGLAGNAMYTKYPRQMLRARTVSEGVRTVCPGATSGMYVPEEVQDFDEPRNVTPRRETVTEVRSEGPALPGPPEEDGIYIACKAAIDLGQTKADLEQWATDNEASLAKIKADNPDVYKAVLKHWHRRVRELVETPKPAQADDFGIGEDEIPF